MNVEKGIHNAYTTYTLYDAKMNKNKMPIQNGFYTHDITITESLHN